MNTATAYIDISPINPYSDASGAPATVRIGDYHFACDMLGEVTLTCTRPGSGSRTQSKIAADRARRAYSAKLAEHVDYAWLVRNGEMYGKHG